MILASKSFFIHLNFYVDLIQHKGFFTSDPTSLWSGELDLSGAEHILYGQGGNQELNS